MSPKVSILIPTYNRADLVVRAINSVLKQGFEEWQLVVSDNASTDGTEEVVQALAASDCRIKCVRTERLVPPIENWLNCLEYGDADLVHWLWSDDWIEPDFYSKMLHALDGRNGIACAQPLMHPCGDTAARELARIPESVPSIHEFYRMLMFTAQLPVSPAAYLLPRQVARRSLQSSVRRMASNHYFRRGIGPDSLMVAEAAREAGAIFIAKGAFVHFWDHEQSISRQRSAELGLGYDMAHFRFLSESNVKLSLAELAIVCRRCVRACDPFVLARTLATQTRLRWNADL